MPDQPPSTDPAAHPHSRRYVLILVSVAVVLAVWGIVSRLVARNALEHEATNAAIPTATTTKAHVGPASSKLVLPGSVQAFIQAPIYARTNGYLKVWYTDIGSAVKKGQLLAEIETPEIDQQLTQAQADLATARANESLANSTNARWQGLLETESVSKQDAEEKAGDAAAKKAAADAAAGQMSRVRDLEAHKSD